MSEAGAGEGRPGPRHDLPRRRRLRRHNDFIRVERSGARAQGAFVALAGRPGRGRVGFTVSKKVSLKATERNLVKRRLREATRTHRAWWEGLDVVVIARAEAVGQTLGALTADLDGVFAALRRALAGARAPDGRERRGHGEARKPRR